MKHKGIAAAFAALVGLTASVALAAVTATTNFDNAPSGTHFASGAVAPVCTVSGGTVSCTGTNLQGVGNTNANVSLVVNASVSGVCHNPGSKSKVVEPFNQTVSSQETDTAQPSRNGRLRIDPISTGVSSADIVCPNPGWTPEVTSVSVTSFTYTVTFVGFEDIGPVFSATGDGTDP